MGSVISIYVLYIKKNKLNEQLYAKHLECAAAWPAYWTTILKTIDNSLQAEMEKLYNNLNKKTGQPSSNEP